jgi:hypothetical protein
MDESSNILLMTDGLANHGLLQTSKDLIGLSRSDPNYQSCIINTMGIQQSADIVLNAELLKQLAIDTNGTFRIVPDAESLQCFVGDVLAGYYLRKYDRVNIEVMSSNGFKGKVIANPLNGFVIRSDRPTRAVFEISPSAIPPFTVTVNAMPAYSFCGLETQTFKRESVLTDDYLVSIIGCVAANAMDQGMISQAIINEVFQIANKHQKLMPLAYALKHFKHYPLHESADTVHMSQQVYNFASLGGAEADVSPAVMELRAASATLRCPPARCISRTAEVFTLCARASSTVISPRARHGPLLGDQPPRLSAVSAIMSCDPMPASKAARKRKGLKALPGWRRACVARLKGLLR